MKTVEQKSCGNCGWRNNGDFGSWKCYRPVMNPCIDASNWKPLARFKDTDERFQYLKSWLGNFRIDYKNFPMSDLTVRAADSFITRMENTNDGGR